MTKPTKKQKIKMLEISNAFLMAEIVELEKENKELQEWFDECYEELRLTRDAVEFAPRSCEPKDQK